MAPPKFATAINCIDGRTQMPIISYMRNKYGVDYVDIITEPGSNKLMADSIMNRQIVDRIREAVEISIGRHGSNIIAIAGHHDCAGNPVPKDTQINQIRSAVKTARLWNLGVEIIGLWVDDKWRVSEVEI